MEFFKNFDQNSERNPCSGGKPMEFFNFDQNSEGNPLVANPKNSSKISIRIPVANAIGKTIK